MLCIVAYKLSFPIDQLFETNLLLFVDDILKINIIKLPIVKYKPILVKLILILFNIVIIIYKSYKNILI